MRSTRTAVLPEPAAAATSKVWLSKEESLGAIIADSCSGVHLTPMVFTSFATIISVVTVITFVAIISVV